MMTKILLAAAFIATVVVVPADAGITMGRSRMLNGPGERHRFERSGENGIGLNGSGENGADLNRVMLNGASTSAPGSAAIGLSRNRRPFERHRSSMVSCSDIEF